jgi:hypothetical protein
MEMENYVGKVLAVAVSGAVVLGFMLGVEPWSGSVPLCGVKLPNGACVQLHEVGVAGVVSAGTALRKEIRQHP